MEELMNALNVIKKECVERSGDGCENCPLGRADGGCNVTQSAPAGWNVEETEIVRVLN